MTISPFPGDLPSYNSYLTSHPIHLLNLISQMSSVGTVRRFPETELGLNSVASLRLPGVQTQLITSEINKA